MTLTAPPTTASNAAQIWQFDLAGSGSFNFTPGTDYALTLSVGNLLSNITWGRVGPEDQPTGLATFDGYCFRSGASGFLPSTDPQNTNSFSITGMVPVPAPLALMAVGLGFIGMRKLRRR